MWLCTGASHDNWCTETLSNRAITAQWEGMGDVGSARYEPALLPPSTTIRVLSYSNCQRSTHSSSRAWQFDWCTGNWYFWFMSDLDRKTTQCQFDLTGYSGSWTVHFPSLRRSSQPLSHQEQLYSKEQEHISRFCLHIKPTMIFHWFVA